MFAKYFDRQIVLYLCIFAVISCCFVYSSSAISSQYSDSFLIKQIIFYILGFILMFSVAMLDMEQLGKISWYFYGLIILLLIGLIFAPESIARPVNEAKSWYQIPFIGTFQPSEFLKFAFVLVVAKVIENHQKKTVHQKVYLDCWLLVKIGLITIPPMLIVYKQPDTGMIMLYLALLIPMIYFSSIHKRILVAIALIPVIAIAALLVLYFQFNSFYTEHILGQLSPHQISRINGWLSPFEYGDSAYQTRQGIFAIGSGEIMGKGYMKNDVYIPEKHTDFIFATIAEETGFVGGSIIILLYFLFIYRLIFIMMKANSSFAYITGAGIIGLLMFQIFQNIGMTMGVLPVTGVTLPFLSYGGSSLLSNFMLIGIILSYVKTYDGYLFQSEDTK